MCPMIYNDYFDVPTQDLQSWEIEGYIPEQTEGLYRTNAADYDN